MLSRFPRNSPCPCGSGKKHKHCCLHKSFRYLQDDQGDLYRAYPMPPEAMQAFETLREKFRAKHGRDPEYVFEGASPMEVIEHYTHQSMLKAGTDPALIYAWEKTGRMLTPYNERFVTDLDIAEWEAAIDEYERNTGQKATHRRFVESDLKEILANGPR